MKDHDSSAMKAALVFGALGFVVGVLFAPKSGKETRDELIEKKAHLKERAASAAREFRSAAEDTARDAQEKASEVATHAKSNAKQAVRNVKQDSSGESPLGTS